MSDWQVEYRCRSCDQQLTYPQVMGSGGCCPCCGYLSKSTVCDYRKVAYRYVSGQRVYVDNELQKQPRPTRPPRTTKKGF